MATNQIQPGLPTPVGKIDNNRPLPGSTPAGGADFKRYLLDNLNKVNQMQNDAHQATEDLALNRETDITKVMTAVEKADVAFQTVMAVRNKLVESYQEVLRMRL